jgi:hypothetical protein
MKRVEANRPLCNAREKSCPEAECNSGATSVEFGNCGLSVQEDLTAIYNPAMQSDDVRAWAERWKEVARAEVLELRQLPFAVKLRQLDALARSASLFDWPSSDEEDERIREMWMTLRRRSGLE